MSVSPPDASDRLTSDPRDELKLGSQPTLQQDVSFGVQFVDVALKALSPSLNDPSTAVNCIHRITELLLEAGRRSESPTTHTDDAGTVRLIAPQHDFGDLVGLAFDQVLTFGGERLYVALALVESLRELQADLPPERQVPIRREVELVAEAARAIEVDEDRRTVARAIEELIGSQTRIVFACAEEAPPHGRAGWSLIGTLMDPVSCVSCVSWWYWVNAAETHETFHWESGMRYQVSSGSICEHQ